MKKLILLEVVLLSATVGWGKDATSVKVEIISSAVSAQSKTAYQPSTLKCDNGGCTGAPGHGYAVVQDEVSATAMINGEKVLLVCGERRRKICYVLAPGVYEGEIKGRSVWIVSDLPATHERVKRRFDIAGTW